MPADLRFSILLAVLSLAAACGDDGRGPVDSSFDTGTTADTGGADSAPADTGAADSALDATDASGDAGDGSIVVPGPAVGFGADRTSLTDARFDCRGTVAAPTPGAVMPRTFGVVDFQSGTRIESAPIQVFPDNSPTPDGACSGSCIDATSDAAGDVTVSVPDGAWLAYRIPASTIGTGTYLETLQVNAAPGFLAVAIEDSTAAGIALILATPRAAGTATITGRARDCDGEDIANAFVRIFDGSTEIDVGFDSSGPRAFYFDSATSLPAPRERRTDVDGLWGVTNVPIPTSGSVRVELWGSLVTDAPPELLGCEPIPLPADGVGIVNVGPQRSDGPGDCSM